MNQNIAPLLLLLVAIGPGCGSGPASPPPRASPALAHVALTTAVVARDPRSGVLLVNDQAGWVPTRLEGSAAVPLGPAAPASSSGVIVFRWFDGGAWLGGLSGPTFVLRGGTWTEVRPEECDPSATQIGLLDARATTDAWAYASSAGGPMLCHFDGVAWSPEPLTQLVVDLVALDDVLVATMGDTVSVFRRPIAGGAWAPVDVGGTVRFLEAAGDGALATLSEPVGVRVLVHGTSLESLDADTVVGLGAERYAVEAVDGQGERCGVGIGGPPCYAVTDWTQFVVYRSTAGVREEIAHVDAYAADIGAGGFSFSWSAFPVGVGRLAIEAGVGLWAMP